MTKIIPYGKHCISEDDIEAVVNVLRGDWLTCGPVTEAFENALCEELHATYTVSCSNGTTALHLALLALGVGPGDFVFVPSVTFLASANAARYVGANIIFVDVDPDTGLMTANTLEAVINQNTDKNLKAVVNVHLAGQCEDLKAIYQVAKKYNLRVIEDAAHAIGTVYDEQYPIGSNIFADITTFSFHPVKTMTTGEGGAATTNDPDLAKQMRLLRSHCIIRDPDMEPGYYEMRELGYNYRICDINCALGLSQLRQLSNFKQKRSQIVTHYDHAFARTSCLKPIRKLKTSNTNWHLYVVLIDFHALGKTRADVMNQLNSQGIGTQVHYIPVHLQPYYRNLYGPLCLPGAETYYTQCLSLPLFVGLSREEQDKIIQTVNAL